MRLDVLIAALAFCVLGSYAAPIIEPPGTSGFNTAPEAIEIDPATNLTSGVFDRAN
ncbi:hypothetical protein OH76DRAFT_1486357 [Lentinus brumalis]|uniref:Uncharacterized protein n=1 Tax=Lentinus brumalis TaxID=2498619 RepID=A0A371CYI1_9APHY|nr:hypothetical protein OH76DRAFT_1486357 [Polyporus brumalis]